jgi:hypothetical protein
MSTRFTIGTTIGGHEVVDIDGRPVSPVLTTRQSAVDLSELLNAAASRGRNTLAKALGAVEDG